MICRPASSSVTDRLPGRDVGRVMRHAPIFAVGVGKTRPDDLDRRAAGGMRPERGDHGLLFRQKSGIPENRDGRGTAVFIKGEKCRPPGPRCPRRLGASHSSRESPVVDALGRLRSRSSCRMPSPSTLGLFRDCIAAGDPGRRERKHPAWDFCPGGMAGNLDAN